jgi:hypothetical protein
MTTGSSDEDNKSVIKSGMSNPAGRPGKDTDMAATVLFLAGPGGVFCELWNPSCNNDLGWLTCLDNEQVLHPDGGNTLTAPAARA